MRHLRAILAKSDPVERPRILEELGDAAAASGKTAQASAYYRQAWDIVGQGARLARKLAATLGSAGEERSALDVLKSLPDRIDEPMERGRCLVLEAQLRYRLEEYAAAERTALRAREWLTQHGAGSLDLATSYHLVGLSRMKTGHYAEARTPLERAVSLAIDGGDWPLHLEAETNLGVVLMSIGDYPAARRRFEAVVRDGTAVGDDRNAGLASLRLGYLEKDQRRFPEARARLQWARNRMLRLGDPFCHRTVEYAQAILAADAEDWPAARIHATRCLKMVREIGDRRQEAGCLILLSLADLAGGRPGLGVKLAVKALTLAQAARSREIVARAKSALGSIEIAQGETASGLRRLEESVSLFGAANLPFEEAVALCALGRGLRQAGRTSEALRLFARARKAFVALGLGRWVDQVDAAGV